MDRWLIVGLLSTLFTSAFGLRCLECSQARDDDDCRRKGQVRECMFNQDACEIELRQHEGWGGHYYIYKHCKQSAACDNNHIQNPRSAWEPSQCNLDDVNSVCRCCCYEDECNVARDACFAKRGCSAQPTNIAYGTVECSDGSQEGSVCAVTCNAYAKLSGQATTVCQGDGTWSNPLAQCLYMQCPERSFLANGWFVCSNGFNVGSQCAAFCRPGYTLVGAESAGCRESMRWSSPPPVCRGLQCPDRGTVEGGTVTCTNENNLQSRCRVECDEFRRLEGISDSYCEDAGTWSHDLPRCVRVECKARSTIMNGEVSCTADYQVNSVCTATCDEGYALDGPAESTCLMTGYWNRPLPRCRIIMCPPRGRLIGGTVACTHGSSVGSVCTATCFPGTLLVGSSVSVCQPDGTWDLPLPQCQVVQCPERNELPNGRLRCDERNVGDRCQAICDRGKRMVGVRSSVCLPTGEWSDPLPTCEDITCPSLTFNQPGTMTCTNDFFYRSRCRFQCDAGYMLVGAPYVSCRRNGRWTTRMPECRLVVCRNRGVVARGTVTCTDTNNVGSVCEVECNEGYTIKGPAESSCLPNGRWSERLPSCQPIQCPPRGSLAFGTVTCTSGRSFGSVCSAECNDGYEMIGAHLSTCGADEQWDRPLPTCQSFPCPSQGSLNHGSISCTNDWEVRSRCSFQCLDEGYQLYPESTDSNVCRRDQSWDVPKPCCTRPCPPYALMDIVLVLDSSSSIGSDNWVKLTAFVERVIGSFEVAPDLANFAVFRYNRNVDTTTQIFLNTYPGSVDEVIEGIRKIPYDGSGTFTGVALDHALTVSLATSNGNRIEVPDLVLLVTDGRAADDVKTPSDSLRAAGVQILVLGIEPPRGQLDMEQLLEIAGSRNNLIVASGGFEGLDTEFSARLGSFICGEPCT